VRISAWVAILMSLVVIAGLVKINILLWQFAHYKRVQRAFPIQWTTDERWPRARIRVTRPEDMPSIFAAIDHHAMVQMGWTQEHVMQLNSQADKVFKKGFQGQMSVAATSSDVVIGNISLTVNADAEFPISLGWWIHKQARKNGIGTDMVGLMIHCSHRAGFQRVGFATAADNKAVIAIAKRVGARLVSAGPQTLPNGQIVDSLQFEHREFWPPNEQAPF
jgi:RimJ/RimL family protein N-acetyltransferase